MYGIFRKLAGGIALMGLLAVFSAVSFAAGAEDELYMMKGGVTYVLVKMSDSPEKYIASAEPGVFFESDGNNASLRFGKDMCANYVLLRETESDEEMILTADDVNYRMQLVESASGAKYEAVGDPTTVFWSKGHHATLTIGGVLYSGYELWLPFGGIWIPGEGVPTDVEWHVKSINGVDVIDGSNVTLTFGADGKLNGVASVNRYTAPWASDGNRLSISMAAVTRMFGNENLMRQEDSFLKALSDVTHFKPLSDGIALLTNENGEIVLSR